MFHPFPKPAKHQVIQTVFLAAILISSSAHAQLRTDTLARQKFREALHQLPRPVQEEFNTDRSMGSFNGIAIIQSIRVDTLNKGDLKKRGSEIIIADVDEKEIGREEAVAAFSEEGPMPAFVKFKSFKDSFFLGIGGPFGFFLEHGVKGKKVMTTYTTDKGKGLVRTSLTDAGNALLKLPCTIHYFLLDNSSPAPGKDLYGTIKLETAPFFEEDPYSFKNGYIHKRMLINYVFKARVEQD